MQTFLIVSQIVLAVLLSLAILFQSKGVGLGDAFGGDGNVYSTKRGAEKFLVIATVVLGILLVVNTLAFAFVA